MCSCRQLKGERTKALIKTDVDISDAMGRGRGLGTCGQPQVGDIWGRGRDLVHLNVNDPRTRLVQESRPQSHGQWSLYVFYV